VWFSRGTVGQDHTRGRMGKGEFSQVALDDRSTMQAETGEYRFLGKGFQRGPEIQEGADAMDFAAGGSGTHSQAETEKMDKNMLLGTHQAVLRKRSLRSKEEEWPFSASPKKKKLQRHSRDF